ncbi:L,D-transpeptidase [Pseudogemmobacter hezensis]|uniref:L,D-transpeptidase n=1 Tax=Pseudogemmobacter hezensis TaxID=2737662 RepID=UPI0020A63CFC|nr:L,D-transpeptidase [Pseudogemmobacter hezensis]
MTPTSVTNCEIQMHMTGIAAPLGKILRKTSLLALAGALALSACVETTTTAGTDKAAPQLIDQPEIVTDATIYAARSDGTYTVPALPVDQIPAAYRRQVVDYPSDLPPGTIVIDPTPRFLYYVLGKGKALRYGIAVGAEGFGWSGESIVSNKRQWPTWTPPAEMIARKPSLEKWRKGQPGGPTNPLGSRAIYLTSNGRDYGYRIHGTPEWKTIGRNASSGCFRMINQDVMDLYERVKGGERVITLTASGQMPTGLNIPKPVAPKKAAVKKPEATPAVPQMIGPVLPGTEPATVTPAAVTPAPAATTPAAPATGATPADATPPAGNSAADAAPATASPAAAAPEVAAPAATTPAPAAPAVTAPVVPAPAATAPAN